MVSSLADQHQEWREEHPGRDRCRALVPKMHGGTRPGHAKQRSRETGSGEQCQGMACLADERRTDTRTAHSIAGRAPAGGRT
eukprot:8737764-Pyramimonas_sp.AAC.1